MPRHRKIDRLIDRLINARQSYVVLSDSVPADSDVVKAALLALDAAKMELLDAIRDEDAPGRDD